MASWKDTQFSIVTRQSRIPGLTPPPHTPPTRSLFNTLSLGPSYSLLISWQTQILSLEGSRSNTRTGTLGNIANIHTHTVTNTHTDTNTHTHTYTEVWMWLLPVAICLWAVAELEQPVLLGRDEEIPWQQRADTQHKEDDVHQTVSVLWAVAGSKRPRRRGQQRGMVAIGALGLVIFLVGHGGMWHGHVGRVETGLWWLNAVHVSGAQEGRAHGVGERGRTGWRGMRGEERRRDAGEDGKEREGLMGLMGEWEDRKEIKHNIRTGEKDGGQKKKGNDSNVRT